MPFLIAEPESSADVDVKLPVPTVNGQSDTPHGRVSGLPTQPVVSPPETQEASSQPAVAGKLKKLLPIVVDVAVGLVLLAIGAFLGSMLAGKPTQQVWAEAGSSVKFPSMDLLMWLAPPVVLTLTYGLLISRGVSVGGWLKRRQAT